MKKNKSKYHEKFDSFYQSKSWKVLRATKFYDSNGICMYKIEIKQFKTEKNISDDLFNI